MGDKSSNMKILFWGIGITAERLEKRLRTECEVIGYTDGRSAIKVYKGKKFYRPEEIRSIFFDYIVVTSDNGRVALDIVKTLEDKYKISEEKILPYYVYANHELYSILLSNDSKNEFECMIFGNSHARDGILAKYCNFNAINFSVSSQDIYGNYITFQKIINEYGYKFSGLKYVIIDLYDYNCLNYDTSLSGEFFNYLFSNGIVDKHNFELNINFKNDEGEVKGFEQQLAERIGIICDSSKREVLERIFLVNEGKVAENYKEIYTNRRFINNNEPLMEEKIFGSLVQKRFENTIKENKELLTKFITAIQSYNPETQIIFTLIPRYITMERVNEIFMAEWKRELYEYISKLKKEYGVLFFDMKTNENISSNNYFYQDICHLNTTGGICLTSILNEYIRKIQMSEKAGIKKSETI